MRKKYKVPEVHIRNYKVPKVIVEEYKVPEIITFVIVKCPYCGVYVQAVFREKGGAFGMGWYCPACGSRIIPRMKYVKTQEGGEDDD